LLKKKRMSFLRSIWNPREWEAKAKAMKEFLQIAIGIGVTILIIGKLALWLDWFRWPPLQWIGEHLLRTDKLAKMATLEVVAWALGYSAAVELAYMLFTEGPDEAVDPVIMGSAAAALLTNKHS